MYVTSPTKLVTTFGCKLSTCQPRRQISVVVWKGILFCSGLAYQPRVSGGNVYRKRIFSKTLSRVEIFYNAGYSFTCGSTKTEVFEYDDVMHHIRLILRLAFSCGRAKTIRIRYVFDNSEKNFLFQKYRDRSEWGRNLVYTHTSCCKYVSFYTQRSSGSFWLSLLCHAFRVLASGRDIFINWWLLLQVNLQTQRISLRLYYAPVIQTLPFNRGRTDAAGLIALMSRRMNFFLRRVVSTGSSLKLRIHPYGFDVSVAWRMRREVSILHFTTIRVWRGRTNTLTGMAAKIFFSLSPSLALGWPAWDWMRQWFWRLVSVRQYWRVWIWNLENK